MTETRNPINDPVLGRINVFRQFIPRDDTIEYTTYFYKDGVKQRHDMKIDSKELEELTLGNDGENFVMQRLYKEIEEGKYVEAGKAIKWEAKEEKMQEVKPDQQFNTTGAEALVPKGAAPTEAELIIITLLMRLYDLQWAQLHVMNERIAEEVFASHEKGVIGNPQMFIPEIKEGVNEE
jgi:hypothetical protein